MARKRRLFTVPSPLGYNVFLERDRWRQITRQKHPAVAGRELEVRACLESPAVVHESSTDADVHMYYATADRGYLCVVVAPADGTDYFVVTAYFTTNIKKGKELWKS